MSEQATAKLAAEFLVDAAIIALFLVLFGPLGLIPALLIIGCRGKG